MSCTFKILTENGGELFSLETPTVHMQLFYFYSVLYFYFLFTCSVSRFLFSGPSSTRVCCEYLFVGVIINDYFRKYHFKVPYYILETIREQYVEYFEVQ